MLFTRTAMFIVAALALSGINVASADSELSGVIIGGGIEAVTIANVGAAPSQLTVSGISIDDTTHFNLIGGGSCPAAPFPLAAGASCTQLVEFDPQSLGTHNATLTVASDADSVNNDEVALSGTGKTGPTPALEIVPDPMDFGLVDAASLPASDVFSISNVGDPGTSLDITGLVLGGDPQFSISVDNCTGLTLFDGDSCTVTIEFDAAIDGNFTGSLTVQNTAGDESAQIQGSTQIPTQLAFVVQPTDTTVAQPITPAVVIEVQDSGGNLVTLDNTTVIDLSLASDPSGMANLDGVVSIQVSGGHASFGDLTIDQVGSGFSLLAADNAAQLTTDTSLLFDIVAGAPAALIFDSQPGDTVVGQTISPAVTVQVVDSLGFPVTSDNATQVSLGLSGGMPGAALGGGGATTVSAGVATFAALSVEQAGSAYQLTSSGSPGGLSGPASIAFDILTASSATTITGVVPAASQTVGQPYTVSVDVTGFSPTGTVTVTDGVGQSCQIVLPANSCNLVSTSAGPRTLTANYPGDANNGSSNGTAPYLIVQQAASVLIDAITPAGSQAVHAPYSVEVSVTGFNPIGTITVDDGDGANCQIVLPSTNCNLISTSVGPKTITAIYPGDTNNSGDSDTAAYNIVAGAPAELVFIVQPTDTSSAVPIAPAVEVQVQDAFGNPALADNTTEITLTLIGGSASVILIGGGPVTVSSGVAEFNSLSVDLAGTGYQLQASASGLNGDTSDPFAVGPGTPVALRFDVQPTNTLVASPITPPVTVSVRDAAGNLVDSDNSTVIELSLSGGTPGALLSNGGAIAVSSGVATFATLEVDLMGTGYQLTADHFNGGLASDTSNLFAIVASSSTTTITDIAPAGSQAVGQQYMVTVSVTGSAPTGNVTVSDGAGAQCTIVLSVDDTCALTSTSAGPKTITASYAGDDNNASSSDSSSYTINPAVSTTTISTVVPASEQVVNQSYTVTVSVGGFNPTGVVNINDGAGQSCQITLPNVSCQLTSTSVGPRTISANYPGDGNNSASSDSQPYEIVLADSTTTILGITPPNEQVVDLPYTVTVDVAGDSPTGTVTIDDGDGAQCTFDLPDISCDLTSTSLGPKSITASYPGDTTNTPSNDSVSYEIVSSGPVSLVFAAQPDLGIVNGPLLPGVVVHVLDSQGQIVITDNTTVIEMAIETNPTGGTLSGSVSLQVENGVADFDDLSIDRLGQGYRLQASVLSRGLPPIQTGFFNVVNDGILQDRFEVPTDDVFQDRFELQ